MTILTPKNDKMKELNESLIENKKLKNELESMNKNL